VVMISIVHNGKQPPLHVKPLQKDLCKNLSSQKKSTKYLE